MGPPRPTVTFRPGMPTNNNLRPPFAARGPPNVPFRPGAPFPPPNQGGGPPFPSNNPQRPPFGGFPLGPSAPAPPPPSNGFPPSPSPSPSPSPMPSNNPPQSLGGFPLGLNSNLPPPNNPQSSSNGFLPGMDSNQTSTANNTSSSPMNQVFQGMNTNQTAPPPLPLPPPSTTPNPPSSFPGFPSGGDSRAPSNPQTNTFNFPNNSQPNNSSKSRPSNDHDENLSRLELDYPIENVLIDANIPSNMAIKINDVVEQDRLGNAYRVHRYTFEPTAPQQLTFNNHQHTNNGSFRHGTRHIREIQQNSSFDNKPHIHRSTRRSSRRRYDHHSQTSLEQYIDQILRTPGSTVIHAQNSDDLQHILNQHLAYPQVTLPQPSVISYPSDTLSYNGYNGPVFYYTARALYDDPMRHY